MTIKRFALAAILVLGIALAAEAGTVKTPADIDPASLKQLDLPTAQALALSANPSLAAAGERIAQAAQRVKQARAAWLPTIDATASASRLRLSDTAHQTNLATARALSANPAATIDDPEDYYGAKLSATWVLFNGFRRHFAEARARWGEEQSTASRDETRRLLLASVAQSYFGAQLARENIAIAEASEAFNQRRLHEARLRRRIGTGSLSDTLNFQIQANAARADKIGARQEYRIARIGLAALIGLGQADLPETVELAPLKPVLPREMALPQAGPLIDYALAHRPDARQSGFALKQAEAGIGTARADFLPTVQVSGSVDGDRANSADFREDDFGDTVGIYLSYNIFSGGLHRAKLAEARRARAEAEKNLAAARITVTEDVRKALADLAAAQEQLTLQRANEALVKQNRDLVEKEYNAGQASLVRLNEAQRDLTQAQSRLARARAALRLAQAALDASTGKILAQSK